MLDHTVKPMSGFVKRPPSRFPKRLCVLHSRQQRVGGPVAESAL